MTEDEFTADCKLPWEEEGDEEEEHDGEEEESGEEDHDGEDEGDEEDGQEKEPTEAEDVMREAMVRVSHLVASNVLHLGPGKAVSNLSSPGKYVRLK